MKTFIQIGTNNGDDEFNHIVKKENPDLVILVEPNTTLNEEIIKNYSFISDRIHIENIAINTKSGPCEVVIPKNPLLLPDGNICELGTAHYTLLPMDDWGNDFTSIKVNGLTFSDLCEKYSISEIDFLQTDTEGFDSEIILSIDFDRIKINKIKYEYWPFDEDQYIRYGKESKKYGRNGMELVEAKLMSIGYKLFYESKDVVAVLKK